MTPEERVEKAFADWLKPAMRERVAADWYGKPAPEVTVTDTQLKALLAEAIRQAVAQETERCVREAIAHSDRNRYSKAPFPAAGMEIAAAIKNTALAHDPGRTCT